MSETYELNQVYKGWTIWAWIDPANWKNQKLYAQKDSNRSDIFTRLDTLKEWINFQITGEGKTGLDYFSPDLHNWVGYLTKADTERENKLVALGPAPPGLAGKLEGYLLVVVIAKLLKTPGGLRVLNNWGVEYLKAVQAIISGISTSSSANIVNCIVNQYVAVRIYQRMGLMSAHDAVQTAAWCDHVMAEMIKAGYFKEAINGLTTLVNATSVTGAGEKTGPSWAGLAGLAKVMGGAVP